jgi:hypothetical protein
MRPPPDVNVSWCWLTSVMLIDWKVKLKFSSSAKIDFVNFIVELNKVYMVHRCCLGLFVSN